MDLENFVKMKALESAYVSRSGQLVDYLLSSHPEAAGQLLTKRLQFDTSPFLFEKVETMCGLLGCSKREFLEICILDGVRRTEQGFNKAYEEAGGDDFATLEVV